MDNRRRPDRSALYNLGSLRISAIYLLIGVLWILFSDKLAERVASTAGALTKISIYKGWGFIVVTAILLYWLIQRHTAELREDQKRLRLITDAIPALIAYMDSNRIYRFSNRTYEDWFGQRADGRPMEEFLGASTYQKISGYVD